MFFVRLGVNEDVIDKHDDELVQVLHENRIHEVCRCISQSERHDIVLVQTVTSRECYLRYVFGSDLDLMIAQSQIDFREYLSSTQLVKQIVNPRKRILILDSDFV